MYDSQQQSMRRITGRAVAMLLLTTSVFAGLSDYPADLSKWVARQPPKVGDRALVRREP